MKTLLKSVYTLAAMGICPLATAQEPPAEAPAGSNYSITQTNLIPMLHMPSYAFYGDGELTINFPAAMVAEETVGKAVDAKYYKLYLRDSGSVPEHTAVWKSTSEICITVPDKHQDRLAIMVLEVPEGVQTHDGRAVTPQKKLAPINNSLPTLESDCDKPYVSRAIFVGSRGEAFDAPLAERVGEAYFYHSETRAQMPANMRQATVGDAVEHWAAYRDAFYYNMEESSPEEMLKLPVDTPLPHTWICEAPANVRPGDTMELILPRAEFNRKTGQFEDSTLTKIRYSEPDIYLNAESLAIGLFRVNISFEVPLLVNDRNQPELGFDLIVSDKWNDEKRELRAEWKDGAWRATINEREIVLTPDWEASSKHLITIPTENGEAQQAYTRLILTADTGGEKAKKVYLTCKGCYRIPFDYEYDEKDVPMSKTTLIPEPPCIRMDLARGHMRRHADTAFRCEHSDLHNGEVRVWKLDATPANVIRTLTAYEKYYCHYRYGRNFNRASIPTEEKPNDRVNRMRAVPTELLVGVQAEAQQALAGAEGETTLRVADMFRGQELGGLYFIEATGESLRVADNDAPVVCQGVVQLTDLGLMWKQNGNRVFAWAYQLSDGKDVAEGKLSLMDAKGKVLAELKVENGVASGEFPAETTYLHLSTAGDSAIFVHDAYESEYCPESGHYISPDLGIAAEEMPRALIYTFADNSIYRPGETAHLKGIIRWVKDNKLSAAQVKTVSVSVQNMGKEVYTCSVTPDAEGNFTVDVPTKHVGAHTVHFTVEYQGDSDNSSPDRALLAPLCEDKDTLESSLPRESRKAYMTLQVEEYRRNEFEVQTELDVNLDALTAKLNTTATNFTTTPVANGEVRWSISLRRNNFYPEQWSEYYFGRFTSPWPKYEAYYCQSPYAGSLGVHYESNAGKLDANGHGHTEFSLPEDSVFGRMTLTAYSYVTNGNQQSIRSAKQLTFDTSEVYVGIREADNIHKVGDKMPVEFILVQPDGNAWAGAPITGTLRVERTSHYSYRYGAKAASSVQNIKNHEVVLEQEISLTGSNNRVEVPLLHAGEYKITIFGQDEKGNHFESSVERDVYGENESPWYYHHDTGLELVADKTMYHAGDTARILVKTPVDAELLVTVERGKVLRNYRRKITVANPVIEIPVEAADAPVVYVSVNLVQSAESRRKSGMPLLKKGVCRLLVDTAEKKLSVALQGPQSSLLPEDACTVSGTVCDAAGTAVPNADVALYAVDEGALQVRGYTLPNPHGLFYSAEGRAGTTPTYSGLGELIEHNLAERDYGNKGIFIGGGDDEGSDGPDIVTDEESIRLRENFTPCALWLGSVKTDAEGKFSTTYTNPDTLTRYRLMAVATTADQFGAAQAAYHVIKPIMLEPVAPQGATEGDLLHLPVTVSMLAEELPQAADGAEVTWTVSLTGTNCELPEPQQNVTLKGNSPVTITFPVRVKDAGKVELQWTVKAADANATGTLARSKDGVKLSFEVIPPTPFVAENLFHAFKAGESLTLDALPKTQYRPGSRMELTISPNPFITVGEPMQYLVNYPHGCSEQLSSALIPWILRDEMELLGLSFPEKKETAEVVSETFDRLRKRMLSAGVFSYWDNINTASDYSPYVVLVSHLANKHGFSHALTTDTTLSRACAALEESVIPTGKANNKAKAKGSQRPNLLALYVAIKCGCRKAWLIAASERVLKQQKDISIEERWMLALCAKLMNHEKAQQLHREATEALEAMKQPDPFGSHYSLLPPLYIIRLLYEVETNAEAESTLKQLTQALTIMQRHYYSSWRNAWLLLTLHEYMEKVQLSNNTARVNGQEVSMKLPIRAQHSVGDGAAYHAESGDTVYLSGRVEGHMLHEQAPQQVDEGLLISRRYEKLLPDGTWQPTAVFELGDIVRVHVTVTPGKGNKAGGSPYRYLAVEDRLPAVMEAINPALLSQALPSHYTEKQARSWWYRDGNVDNAQFLMDRVRFYSSWTYYGKLEAKYVARVVRKGKVTAPAAKAELMYSPEVRGLSIPATIEVK